jgi:hypothetical protein
LTLHIIGLHNGANANPTYGVYAKSNNSIILGQKTVSRKSNTGGVGGAEPYAFVKPGPLVINANKQKSKITNIRV